MGTYDWLKGQLFASPDLTNAGEAFSPASDQTQGRWKQVCIAFDTETTGLDPKRDRIVEIGAVKFDERGIIARFSTLIYPGIPMPEEAGKVNGITDAMLAGKPTAVEVLPDFLRFIEGGILVAHNAPFDVSFIQGELERIAQEAQRQRSSQEELLFSPEEKNTPSPADFPPDAPKSPLWHPPYTALPHAIVDTRILAKELFPNQSRYSLQDLAVSLGLVAKEAHRAEDDARLCMELFLTCLKRL